MLQRRGQSYIGVTGFTNKDQVHRALDCLPPNPNRLLMIGVLDSYKSVRGIPLRPQWQARYPAKAEIANLFCDDERVLNLLHFGGVDGDISEDDLLDELLRVRDLAGSNCHGFQLNMIWPSRLVLECYREDYPHDVIVLQVGSRAQQQMSEIDLLRRLKRYFGLADHFLLDPSGGQGKPFQPQVAISLLKQISEWYPNWFGGAFLPAVAGGLCAQTLPLVEPVVKAFPITSFDAEGRLMSEVGQLDDQLVADYIQASFNLPISQIG